VRRGLASCLRLVLLEAGVDGDEVSFAGIGPLVGRAVGQERSHQEVVNAVAVDVAGSQGSHLIACLSAEQAQGGALAGEIEGGGASVSAATGRRQDDDGGQYWQRC